MTILIKGGAGLLAGVFAGVLGYCFWPHAEPDVRAARPSVETPVFVVAAASSRPAPAPSAPPLTASSVSPPVDKTGLDKLALALKSSGAPDARRMSEARAASPTPSPAVAAASPLPVIPRATPAVLVASASATTPLPRMAAPVAAPAISEDARSWSAQGLIALADGDLAAARLFLQRAADAGDSRALMALAETYNPATLARLGVVGAHGDPARARDYLAQAVAAGLGAAKDRIAALEAQGN